MRKIVEQRGAAMVEFAASAVFVLIILGAIFDIGFALYEYTFLHYSTTRAAREIAARLTTSNQCATVEDYLVNVTHKEMASSFAVAGTAKWDWCFVKVGNQACLISDRPPFRSL